MKYFITLIFFTLAQHSFAVEKPPKNKWDLTEKEKECIIENVYYEGVGDIITAYPGFIEAVVNRRSHRKYPNDACKVIFEKNAFSWTRQQSFIPKNQRDRYMVAILVNGILDGYRTGKFQEVTYGATHYHADYVSPCWIADMKRTTKLGKHIFYVEKRRSGACSKKQSRNSKNNVASL